MAAGDVAKLCESYLSETGSGEHAAVAVFLTYARITASERFGRNVSAGGIDWEKVLAEDWSSTERFLLGCAAGFWRSSHTDVDISRVGYLDDDQYALWQDMLTAVRTGRAPR